MTKMNRELYLGLNFSGQASKMQKSTFGSAHSPAFKTSETQ